MSYPWLLTAHTGVAAKKPSIASRLVTMLGIHRERRSLDQLDAALLEDIGITRDQARKEARRNAWDVPAHRMF